MSAQNEITAFLKLNGSGFKRGLNRARKDLNEFRRGMNAELAHVGLAAAGLAVGAASIGIAFEKQMKNVQAVSGATGQEFAALASAARKMGAETSFSAKQAAEAEYALASAGLNVQQTIGALPAVLMYAGATQAGLGESAEAVTGALNAFNLAVDQSDRVVNVFAAGIAATPMTMSRLSEALAMGGSAAHALDISLEETVAGLGMMHAANITGSQAGTYYRSVLMGLTTAMNEQKGSIGAALQGWNSGAEGLQGALRRLERAGVTGRVALSEFGREGGPALAALLAQGSGKLAEYTKRVTGTSDAFDQYKVQMDSTSGRLANMMSAIEEMALLVWDVIKGPLNAAIVGLTRFIEKNYANIAAAARTIVDGLLHFARVAGDVFSYIRKHSDAFSVLGTVVGIAVAALYALATVLAIIAAVSAANPLTWWITAAVALIAAVAVLVEKFIGWRVVWAYTLGALKIGFAWLKGGFRMLWADIKQVVRLNEALASTIEIVFSAVWTTIKTVAGLVGDTFSTIWEAVKHPSEAKAAFDGLKDAFADGLGSVMDDARDRLVATWSGIGDEYRTEMATIRAEVDAETARSNAEMKRKVAQAQAERKRAKAGLGSGGGAPALPKVEVPLADPWAGLDAKLQPKPDLIKPLKDAKEEIFSVLDELNQGAKASFTDMWDSFADSSMTGAERARQVFAGLRQMVWGVIGQIAQRWIWGEAMQMAATTTKETVTTAAVAKGTATRSGLKLKEMAIDLKTGVVNIWHAVTSFFKAHAGIPFLGVAMAAGAVAIMFKLIGAAKKALFYDGGLVGGPPGRDAVNAGLTRGEFVMPVDATRMWLPILEQMRNGSFSGAPAMVGAVPMGSSGGSITLHTTVQVSSGSLLLADNDLSVRRFADMIAAVIENKVEKTFRRRK